MKPKKKELISGFNYRKITLKIDTKKSLKYSQQNYFVGLINNIRVYIYITFIWI